VQLSIFLIDLFVGTYRLSSHARLEAFVIQTKLKKKLTGLSSSAFDNFDALFDNFDALLIILMRF